MSKITGIVEIDFHTENPATQKQFEDFERKLRTKIEEYFEDVIFDLAHDCGFEADQIHPIMLEELNFVE